MSKLRLLRKHKNLKKIILPVIVIFIAIVIAVDLFFIGAVKADLSYDVVERVVYKNSTDYKLDLSICSPFDITAPAPVIVFFHGGGLRGGDLTQGFDRICNTVVPHGYVVVSANYRLAPLYPHPAQLDDAQYVIRWVRSQASVYNINPDKIIVSGSSAGASLAAIVATRSTTRNLAYGLSNYSSRVQGTIVLAGVYNFSNPELLGLWNPTQTVFQGNTGHMRSFSAINHVSNDDGPFLLLHGDYDVKNLPIQSKRMRDQLQLEGVPVTLFTFPGVHAVGNLSKPEVQEAIVTYLTQYFPID